MLCNYLQNVAAITYIFVLQLSTFLFYNKQDCTENYVDEHTLTTTLSRIRGKIETNGTVYIKTVYGMGYKWTGGEPA